MNTVDHGPTGSGAWIPAYSRPGKIDTGKIDTFHEISRNFKRIRVGFSKDLR